LRKYKPSTEIFFRYIKRQLSESKRKKIRESEEYNFYRLIFKKIKEENFAVLYSENGSRPNPAVNIMVLAIILGYRKGWTIKELLKQIDFNFLTRTALGLNRMDDTAFCEGTAGILFCSGAMSGEQEKGEYRSATPCTEEAAT